MKTVFISYAHKDGNKWVQAIQDQLGGLKDRVDDWSDHRLQVGEKWGHEIEAAMDKAACAVFVVTPGFLNSKFIQQQEVPKLLKKRSEEGMYVLPVLAVDCTWEDWDYLKETQMLAGEKPLKAIVPTAKRDKKLKDLAIRIKTLLGSPTA